MSSSSLTSQPADKACPKAKNPKIVVVHGTPLVRRGIESALAEALLVGEGQIYGFASVECARDVLMLLNSGDLILIDSTCWSAEGTCGASAGKEFLAAKGNGATIALMSNADASAQRLLAARGIAGVLAQDITPEALAEAVVDLLEGKASFPKPSSIAIPPTGLSRLSNRQFEILELMTRGLLNKQIAWELGLTEGTVKSHVSAILEKLGCDRRTQAIATFMQSFGVGNRSMAI